MHRLPRPTPALAVALLALFFALGGTALAVGAKELAAQARCAPGAIRGVALVTGEKVGLDTLTGTYTANPALFRYRWSCAGTQILVRKVAGETAVDVKFVGNPAKVAIVSSAADGTPNGGSVARQPDGSFRVTMGGANTGVAGVWQAQWNVPFVIVLL